LLRETGDFIGTLAYDPASMADGTGLDIVVPVPGARVGDTAVASFSLDLAGVMLTCEAGVDVVNVRLQNETNAVVDLGAGFFRAMVWQK
jgi:hypothetical protein